MTFDATNTGILSRNERKTQEKHADFRGQLNVEGVDYWLDGYVKERKDGSGKFFSLRVKRKDASKQQATKPTPAAHSYAEMPGDIPF